MIYRMVFIWPAINRGLPRRPREGICRKKLQELEPPSPGRRICIVCVCVCAYGFYIYIFIFSELYALIFSMRLSPPFVNTLLIMYTHESITGHRGLSYHHFAAFIQRFFGNNFPRRTRRTYLYIYHFIYT